MLCYKQRDFHFIIVNNLPSLHPQDTIFYHTNITNSVSYWKTMYIKVFQFSKRLIKKNLCKSFAVDFKKYLFYYQYLYIYLLYVFFAHCKRANLNIVSLIKKCNHRRIVSPCLSIQNYYNGLLLDQYMVYVIENRTDKGSLRLPYLTISYFFNIFSHGWWRKLETKNVLHVTTCDLHMTQCDLHTWLIVTFTQGLLWHLHTSHCGTATHDSLWPSPTTQFDLYTWFIVTFKHESLCDLHTRLIVTFTYD